MSATDGSERDVSPLAAWAGFIAMCIGMFMAILDIQIVTTSLPEIQRDLAISTDMMSWVQTGYLIAEVISIPLTGWLTRVLGLRGIFVTTATAFIAASAGCAASSALGDMLVWRAAQGFAGGMLIPLVFSAAFILFPVRGQRVAATIAGMLAVLAPTVGPLVGGWITTNWSWHWLFLINIGPGVLAVLIAVFSLPRDKVQLTEVAKLDIVAIIVLATTLTTLELGLKQAPGSGWLSWQAGGFLAAFFILGWIFVARMRASDRPIVDLTPLGDRNFALACVLSFILGLGLYGNVYLMPVFLAYVSGHDAFEIGQVMLVTGAAQLVAAPIVVALEGWINARILSVFGFCLFAFGLYLSAGDNPRADFDQMLLPQMVRGCAIMFCLLPPTRIALGALQPESVPNASAMFNLMRNLGGAIGIALIDTVLFGRAPGHGADLAERLLNRQPSAYTFVGLPQPLDSVVITDQMKQLARPAVERAALTLAVDEAWTMLAALTTLGVLAALAVRTDATRGSSSQSKSH